MLMLALLLPFSVLCADNKQAKAVRSQFQQIVRAMYSSPPVHGILLVSTILNDPELRKLWEEELEVRTPSISYYMILVFFGVS